MLKALTILRDEYRFARTIQPRAVVGIAMTAAQEKRISKLLQEIDLAAHLLRGDDFENFLRNYLAPEEPSVRQEVRWRLFKRRITDFAMQADRLTDVLQRKAKR